MHIHIMSTHAYVYSVICGYGTCMQCSLIFELHCKHQNILLLFMTTSKIHFKLLIVEIIKLKF